MLFLISFVALSAGLLSGCVNNKDNGGSENNPPVYKHTITVEAETAEGTVTGGGVYDYNTSVVLTAIPQEGYFFDSWQDTNSDNPRTINVTGDKTYTANFKQGFAIKFNNHRVVVINGSAVLQNNGELLTITANSSDIFGYWQKNSNASIVYSDNSSFSLSLSDVTENIKFTAINSAVGYGFMTLKNSASLDSLNALSIKTKSDITIKTPGLENDYSEVGLNFYSGNSNESIPTITYVNGKKVETYNISLRYTYDFVAIYKFYNIYDNNDQLFAVGAKRLENITGGAIPLSSKTFGVNFSSNNVKYVINVSFINANA